jgi:hypothetical protein
MSLDVGRRILGGVYPAVALAKQVDMVMIVGTPHRPPMAPPPSPMDISVTLTTRSIF